MCRATQNYLSLGLSTAGPHLAYSRTNNIGNIFIQFNGGPFDRFTTLIKRGLSLIPMLVASRPTYAKSLSEPREHEYYEAEFFTATRTDHDLSFAGGFSRSQLFYFAPLRPGSAPQH